MPIPLHPCDGLRVSLLFLEKTARSSVYLHCQLTNLR